jgi:hypothetical protein
MNEEFTPPSWLHSGLSPAATWCCYFHETYVDRYNDVIFFSKTAAKKVSFDHMK